MDHIENEPARHIKTEGEVSQSIELQGRIEKLEATIQQNDLVIRSKDDLLKVKEETLKANEVLMSDKDKIIKVQVLLFLQPPLFWDLRNIGVEHDLDG